MHALASQPILASHGPPPTYPPILCVQVLCTLLAMAGVCLVAFYSNVQDVCVPANITNTTNVSDVFDYAESALPACKDPGPEQSTPLGYVVSLSVAQINPL